MVQVSAISIVHECNACFQLAVTLLRGWFGFFASPKCVGEQVLEELLACAICIYCCGLEPRKNFFSVYREEGLCLLFPSFFDNCSVLSYRLLQAPCANRKDDADQSDVELSESLSELYQRKFSETSAAAGSGNNKKRRMYTLGLYVHVVKKR